MKTLLPDANLNMLVWTILSRKGICFGYHVHNMNYEMHDIRIVIMIQKEKVKRIMRSYICIFIYLLS